jgi:hypothetical protein
MSDHAEKEVFQGNLTFNGVNAATGEYALPPMSGEQLARFLQGKGKLEDLELLVDEQRQEHLEQLTDEQERRRAEDEAVRLAELQDKVARQGRLGGYPVKEGVDPTRLEQAGWAVVFPAAMDGTRLENIKAALKPLLDLRLGQAGEQGFRIFEGGAGYRPGERKDQFFKRQDPEIRAGPADPAQMPFYVLLVGSPEEIPYEFQFQLDVMRGVGRLDFGEEYEACYRYAQSVVLAETGKVKLPRRAAFWGVAGPNDDPTQLSARWLVQPLYANLQQPRKENEIALQHPWEINALIGERQATKEQLKRLLGGDSHQAPALLFTASHGVEFPLGHELQASHQGALLCQDWAGPGHSVTPDHYFAAEDLGNADVLGMLAMLFACYGAGTPKFDHFAMQAFKAQLPIAPSSFVGALPKRLLSQGALAVIGHVERAWGYSFVSPGNHLDNQAFVTALRKLLNGEPVGLATDPSFDMRYADLSTNLNSVLEEMVYTPDYVTEYELAHLWTASSDARNYVVLGDPAACIPFARPDEQPTERPAYMVACQPAEPKTPVAESIRAAELPPEAEQKTAQPLTATLALSGPQAFTLAGTVTLRPAGTPETPAFDYRALEGMPFAKGFRLPWAAGKEDEDEETKEGKKKLSEAIQSFIQNAAKAIGEAAREAATLQIVTYTMDDLDEQDLRSLLENEGAGEAAKETDRLKEIRRRAQPQAITRVSALGDIQVYVPRTGGEIDKALWDLHVSMVQQAQDNRNAQLKMLVEVLSQLAPG